PTTDAGCQGCGMSDRARTVRRCPLASTAVGGNCYSLGYSVVLAAGCVTAACSRRRSSEAQQPCNASRRDIDLPRSLGVPVRDQALGATADPLLLVGGLEDDVS